MILPIVSILFDKETLKFPIMILYLIILILYTIWGVANDPILKFCVWKYPKIDKINSLRGLNHDIANCEQIIRL